MKRKLWLFHGVVVAMMSAYSFAHAASRRALASRPIQAEVTLLGEVERVDGTWQGIDLFDTSDAAVDRVQLTLRPRQNVRVRLELIEGDEPEAIFPAGGGSVLLRAGQAYALPGPNVFYSLDDDTHLRLVMTPEGAPRHEAASVAPRVSKKHVTYALTDGAPFRALTAELAGEGTTNWEISLARNRQASNPR